ncbi:3-deoxy-D-manno-octulosonic acid kinase [Vibrio ulleungensis]|uniref:3-deoxy-D-manno-octulosonic acid kinase n=1 Tax=Vibrio ulleungensis TaxID=2807619 RepID=A0ABS2HKV2_9VIBR|nr:3-deoxy-D-manno-octulosonic acid kinase [Vibrio ulleungensis]MBM7037674.1 3-deoxy-D-manno-octulosonic acid kinase [Vibrio ulleungensis]
MIKIRVQEHPKHDIWFDNDLITQKQALLCLDIEKSGADHLITGKASGRGTTWFLQLTATLEVAVRRYRRGGVIGRFIKERFFFLGTSKLRSYAELKLLEKLSERGVHVPKPVCASVTFVTPFSYTADIVTQRIHHARDLAETLSQSTLPTDVWQTIGIEIAKMHNIGVNHTDLNLRNIMLDSQQQAWLIDFDKCIDESARGVGFLGQTRWKTNNLSRLKRSLLKEQSLRTCHWSENDWQTLLDSYHQTMAQP